MSDGSRLSLLRLRQPSKTRTVLFCRTDTRVEDEETIRCLPGRPERRCVGCALLVDCSPLAEPSVKEQIASVPPSFSPASAYSVYTLRFVIPRPRRITLRPTTVKQPCLKPHDRPTFDGSVHVLSEQSHQSFSSIPLLSMESGVRWNRTLHSRGESRSPFRVETGQFSIYVYVQYMLNAVK